MLLRPVGQSTAPPTCLNCKLDLLIEVSLKLLPQELGLATLRAFGVFSLKVCPSKSVL
jgi:hypothetical protein